MAERGNDKRNDSMTTFNFEMVHFKTLPRKSLGNDTFKMSGSSEMKRKKLAISSVTFFVSEYLPKR